jgi:hypothetical protein
MCRTRLHNFCARVVINREANRVNGKLLACGARREPAKLLAATHPDAAHLRADPRGRACFPTKKAGPE